MVLPDTEEQRQQKHEGSREQNRLGGRVQDQEAGGIERSLVGFVIASGIDDHPLLVVSGEDTGDG
ncbi:MAG: hypothetical protein ACRDK7_01585 [Solirubrobacteraceae bacterium]